MWIVGVSPRIWGAVQKEFAKLSSTDLGERAKRINDFRNTHVAHGEAKLTDAVKAEEALREWVEGLREVWRMRRS